MEFLAELWVPILLSAVLVFVASSIIHMATPLHKKDFRGLPGEEQVLAALRASGVQPGEYMFPYAPSMEACGSPEMQEKFRQGPVGMLSLWKPGPINMGRSLTLWFLYCAVVSVFTAYAGWNSLDPGTPYLTVFRVVGATAFLAYALGGLPNWIWKGQPGSTAAKFLLDGLIYSLLTAGSFAWRWPEAAAGV
jgi:hypothetical protein